MVGLYGAAERVFDGACFVPYAVAEAAYPSFSRAKTEKAANIDSQLSAAMATSVGVAVTVATICFVMAEPAMRMVYGTEFGPAAAYLSILVWALPLLAVAWTCSSLLQAVNRQAAAAVVGGVAAAVQAAACTAVAGQTWGGIGICVSWIVTAAVMALTSYSAVLKSVPQLSVAHRLLRLAISGAVLVGLSAVYRQLAFGPSLVLLLLSTAAYGFANGLVTPNSLRRLGTTWRRSLGGDQAA